MADISKIKPNGADGTEYDVKDATARSAIANKANNTQTFTEASTRTNIASGENMATLFGKIKKFFSDLKTVAFTGAYSDLSGQPTIPAAVAVKGNAESTYRTGNVNLTPANIGALASNGTAVAATKATQDGDGNTISTTYMKKGVDYVTAGKSSSSTLGTRATAEGDIVTASGDDSHAEGYNTQAIGYAAHAEGYRTVSGATGSNNYGAHAEGYVTKGTGYASHAEGLFTEAKGMGAHAEGYGTIARAYQHVEGQFNVEDTNNVYAHIIGGGSDDNNKKNIFTVDWNGDVCAGRSNGLTNDLKLPTGADVISYLNSNKYIKLLSKTVSVTFDANGYCQTDLPLASTVILFAKGVGFFVFPFDGNLGNYWYLSAKAPGNMSPLSSITRSVTIFYINIS